MNFDIDFLKAFRDTFYWGEEKGKSIIQFRNKTKLNSIINSISDLIAHKKQYLYEIQFAMETKDQSKINTTILNHLKLQRKIPYN